MDSHDISLKFIPLITKEFCKHLIEMDERLLESVTSVGWLRKGIFRIYNLALGLDIDDYCNHPKMRRKGGGKSKER